LRSRKSKFKKTNGINTAYYLQIHGIVSLGKRLSVYLREGYTYPGYTAVSYTLHTLPYTAVKRVIRDQS
jgi:hypothetical protein